MESTEKELLQKIKRDPSAFGLLFDAYYQPILSYVFRRTLVLETAQDITSEVFLKAFLNIRSFTWKGISVSHWLYRIASNEVNLFFRKSKKYTPNEISSLYDASYIRHITVDTEKEKEKIEEELKQNELFVGVQKRLAQLPVKYQEVISLKYFEQLTVREIALILNKREGTIKSLLSRGISKLRLPDTVQPKNDS